MTTISSSGITRRTINLVRGGSSGDRTHSGEASGGHSFFIRTKSQFDSGRRDRVPCKIVGSSSPVITRCDKGGAPALPLAGAGPRNPPAVVYMGPYRVVVRYSHAQVAQRQEARS